jgi:hypothetical protein
MPSIETKYYMDTLIIATLLADDPMIKNAQLAEYASVIISSIVDYVKGKIDPNNRVESIGNLLGPGILAASGFGWLGFFLEIAETFGWEPSKLLKEIWDGIKDAVIHSAATNTPIQPEQVDAVTQQVLQNNPAPIPTEQTAEALQRIKGGEITFRDAQIYKVAMTHVASLPLDKRAQIATLARLLGMKAYTSSILGKVLGWIVKTVLATGGFMAFGALVEHIKSSLTGESPTSSSSSPSPSPSPSSAISTPASAPSTQQLFKVNPNYVNQSFNINSGWIEAVPPSQIEDQIVSWAEEIYPDLKGKDNFIHSSQVLQALVNAIQQYNSNNTANVTFMPKNLTSRKMVVDMFIDELAVKAKELTQTPPAVAEK